MAADPMRFYQHTSGDGISCPLELYVHIPFCVRKCLYCDFYSRAGSKEEQEAYVKTVLDEIGECPFGEEDEVTSVFFGGGTPSVLEAGSIAAILLALRKKYRFSPDVEITVECNPGTLTIPKLEEYREAGINRLSLGLQSADDAILRSIGRIHSFADFEESMRMAREAGFRNINADLILGLPNETPENFEKGLKKLLALKPEHLSAYSLIIGENTPFFALREAKKLNLPTEEDERTMYHLLRRVLFEAGYVQYEISNFALPGCECRHNIGYWTHVPYLGFGSAAASFYGGKRFRNADSLNYPDLPYEDCEELTADEWKNEFLMLKFRMNEGVSAAEFQNRFGISLFEWKGEEIEKLLREGLIRETKKGGDTVFSLSERGLDLANLVFMEFI